MTATINTGAFRDVLNYPPELLRHNSGTVEVPVTYRKTWDDGFGARGWKVNATIGDPEIIASTRETGERVTTSVFVHDILDHFLSGFGVSGHRSEAMALIQLSKRTGSDPKPDYKQIIREDFFNGRINGESFMTFLPNNLLSLLPVDREIDEEEIMLHLKKQVIESELEEQLVDQFFSIGMKGEKHASESFNKLGLDSTIRKEMGVALQAMLDYVDRCCENADKEKLDAAIKLNNKECVFVSTDKIVIPEKVFRVTVVC